MRKIMNNCVMKENDVPEEWNDGFVSWIYKKGDKKSKNYQMYA